MIQFLKKHQKQLSIGLAVSVLILCYFQRKEINKLREQVKMETIKIDSLNLETINQEAIIDTIKY